jgi:cell division protein FtsQ
MNPPMNPTMNPTAAEAPPKIIDPKFRARRVAVKRQQGRRRLRLILGSVGVATVAGGLFLATQSSLLDVDRIDVMGSEHTPAPVVAHATRVARGAPLVWLNRGAAAHRVEQLPWVQEAAISRRLPGRVRVRVIERRPVAYASRSDGTFAVLDRTGRVLTVSPTRTTGAPEIAGAGAPPAPGQILSASAPALRALRALPADLRSRAVAVDVAGGLTVRFGAGPEARLGSTDELTAKVAALHAVLANIAATGRAAAYIDVRVASAPVVG